jgi:AcrR family transcriptional regulator
VPTPATVKGEQTRRQILDAAADVFAERGYWGASLNQLIGRHKITKGSFYFYFGSKEALALAVFKDLQERTVARLMARAKAAPTALVQMRSMFIERARLNSTEPSVKAIPKLCHDLMNHPELGAEMSSANRLPVLITRDLLSQAQADGEVRADVDVDAVAEAIVGAVMGFEELSEQTTGGRDFPQRVERFLDMFLPSLKRL